MLLATVPVYNHSSDEQHAEEADSAEDIADFLRL